MDPLDIRARSDEALVADYLGGEAPAFDELVRRYLPGIYRFASRLTNGSPDANDVAQEVFVKAWKALERFDQARSFRAWLYAIARNAVIDWARKRKDVTFSKLDGEADEPRFEDSLEDAMPWPEEVAARGEASAAVDAAIATLPPDRQAVVLMHDAEGLTFEEIAEALERPMNTVKSQYRRALQTLRARLGQGPRGAAAPEAPFNP